MGLISQITFNQKYNTNLNQLENNMYKSQKSLKLPSKKLEPHELQVSGSNGSQYLKL